MGRTVVQIARINEEEINAAQPRLFLHVLDERGKVTEVSTAASRQAASTHGAYAYL